jgi:general secretion pathway protein C
MNINDILTNIHFSQRTMIGISTAIALLVVVTFFYSTWQWHNDWVLAHQTTPSSSLMTKTDEAATMISAIPDKHLFGKALTKTGDMPITNLQLRVTGIVKVDTEKYGAFSKAYISISGQPSKIYEIGDTLPYGVKVYDITSDTVILENDGHFEKLPLPREPLKFKPKPAEEYK